MTTPAEEPLTDLLAEALGGVLADRALDSWLAEHLFALNVEWSHWFQGPNGYCRSDHDNGHPKDPFEVGEFDALPLYSSTGDGMLRVIEAMRERGWWGTTNSPPGMPASGSFWRINPHGGAGPHGEPVTIANDMVKAESASLPRAVAEAARAALEAAQPGGVVPSLPGSIEGEQQ